MSKQQLENFPEFSQEDTARILKSRAEELAKEDNAILTAQATMEVVEFLVACERYAFELYHIREVCPLKQLTYIPGVPDFVLGITNVRGQIVSIIDLKKIFDLPDQGLTDLKHIVIIKSKVMEFGILADEIVGVKSIPVETIQDSLATFTGIREKYLRGVTAESLVILDGEKVLSDVSLILCSWLAGIQTYIIKMEEYIKCCKYLPKHLQGE